ncbi:MAG: heme-binding domain-containing protein [Planctomycetes bacterium]|nr:heme-binding domain-containing protein [Planctomycetota bacterium]MCB9904893.1 heme-binding domain-containing protein [Planctomycetota bacterium]
MKLLKKILLGVALFFLLIQVVRPAHLNPPVVAPLHAPDDVMAILRKSCYDCHSNETRWAWYSHVAPVSWLVAHDVEEGREHLNFSEWTTMDAKARRELGEECIEEIAEGEMPLWFYTPLHPGSKVDGAELATLRKWAESL